MYESLYNNKRPAERSARPATPDPWQTRGRANAGRPAGRTPDPWQGRGGAVPPRRKKRRVLPVMLICLGALLALALIVTPIVLLARGAEYSFSFRGDGWKNWDSWGDRDVPHPYEEDEHHHGETTIPGCAARPDLRLPLADGEPEALTDQEVYDRVIPSIVGIRSWDDRGSYSGTGIVVAEDGYVLTNEHVISGCHRASVVLPDGSVRTAKLVGADADTDLALLKIEATGLVPAAFGNSNRLEVGQHALAIGNPLGERFWGTMTDGIISALDRYVEVEDGALPLIQTNAAINAGNSGGALVNEYGQVVGITNQKMMRDSDGDSVEGLGFAIPSVTVREMVHRFIGDSHPTDARVGITVRPVTRREHEHGGLPYGLYVAEVVPGCSAAESVQEGDILITANGEPMLGNADLLLVRSTMEPGDTLRLELMRSGEGRTAMVELYAAEE